MELVDKFLKECVCAGQCLNNGIAAFTPECVISPKNQLPESKIAEFCEDFLNER